MKKIIAISGTPGTGKTAVSRILARKMNANLISIHDIVKKRQVVYTTDRKRNTKVVSISDLQKAVNRKIKPGLNIIEGHFSHDLRSDVTIVLRCNPIELAKRLKRKGWKKAKIKENIEAELIGIISAEARRNKNVMEIDTTGKRPGKTAEEIIAKMKMPSKKPIDWLKPRILLKLGKALK
ncbi:MAG: adenylate kinase family protein [Candidatus Aenigmarchaeota archaeon]|nr:adenylate kinase family protein [Candidatus Aenigmarchaeota archaeon]